jgi:hypothetical protein
MKSIGDSLVSSPKKEAQALKINENILDDASFVQYLQTLSQYDSKVRSIDKKLKPVNEKMKKQFGDYIQHLGAELLKIKDPPQSSANEHNKQKNQAFRKLGRFIKVDELDEDGLSIVIDNEWKTKFWSAEMIESACEALVLVFSNPSLEKSQEKKEKGLAMLSILMNRHRVAEIYIQQRIETMIGKIADLNLYDVTRYHSTKNDANQQPEFSLGSINLLYILHHFREKFINELSRFNFCGLVVKWIMAEARLAAILIQSSFRMNSQRTANLGGNVDMDQYRDSEDYQSLRATTTEHRHSELRAQWRSMHSSLTWTTRKLPGGIRGSACIPSTHYTLILELLRLLVSDQAGNSAVSNRELILNRHCCILLSSYIYHSTDKLAEISTDIIINLSKLPESYFHLLQVDIIHSFQRYFRHQLLRYKAKKDKPATPTSCAVLNLSPTRKKKVAFSSITSDDKDEERQCSLLVAVILAMTNIGNHAAGIYHANEANKSYSHMLLNIHPKVTALSLHQAPGFDDLLNDFASFSLKTNDINAMSLTLKCFLSMTNSPCQEAVIVSMTSRASRLLVRLVQLLEEPIDEIAIDALALIMQCCGNYPNRDRLLSFLPALIRPLLISTNHYDRKAYQKAMLIACGLCRQDDREHLDPESLRNIFVKPEKVHEAVCLDLLRSMKSISMDDKHSIPELVLMRRDAEKSRAISLIAKQIGAKGLCDYFTHPSDEYYHHSLNWTDMACICTIVDCLSVALDSCQQMQSRGTISFLIHLFHLSQYHFHGNPVPDHEAMVILTAVSAAARTLDHFCLASIGRSSAVHDIVNLVGRSANTSEPSSSDLMDAVCFFLRTLTIPNQKLDNRLQDIQLDLALSLIGFCDSYALMVLSTDIQADLNAPSALADWEQAYTSGGSSHRAKQTIKRSSFVDKYLLYVNETGRAITMVLKSLRVSHGRSSYYEDLLDKICQLLTKLTVAYSSASRAHVDWDLMSSLQAHLPQPNSFGQSSLSRLDDTNPRPASPTSSSAKSSALDLSIALNEKLPTSMFQLLANMCQLDEARARCLSDGFFRRSIEKLLSLKSELITVPSLALTDQAKLKHQPRKILRSASESRRSAVVILKLVNCMAHFHRAEVGNANDIIFARSYHLIGFCQDILKANLSSDSIVTNQQSSPLKDPVSSSSPNTHIREDELIVQLVRTISILSKDVAMFAPICEDLDLLRMVIDELKYASEYPLIVMDYYVDLVRNIASGPRSPYLNSKIQGTRSPLLKLIQIYPELEEKIRECNWKVADVSRGSGARFRDILISEEDMLIKAVTQNHPAANGLNESRSSSTTISSLESQGLDVKSDRNVCRARSLTGKYCDCGLTSCGSLRLDDNTLSCTEIGKTASHGNALKISPEQTKLLMTSLPLSSYEQGVCEISRLSARDKDLQVFIEHRKIGYGYKKDPHPLEFDNIIQASFQSRSKNKKPKKSSSLSSVSNQLVTTSPSRKDILLEPIDQATLMKSIAVISVEDLPELARTRPPRRYDAKSAPSISVSHEPSDSTADLLKDSDNRCKSI